MTRRLLLTGVIVSVLGLRAASAGEFIDGVPWIGLGGSEAPDGIAGPNDTYTYYKPAMKLDALGHPTVAWSEGTGSNRDVWLQRWNGSAWEELAGSSTGGGISDSPELSDWPHVALEADGDPVVAWQENFTIHVVRWDGGAWTGYGDSATGAGISGPGTFYRPSVGLDAQGYPVVVYSGNVYPRNLYCRRWDGAAWVDVGAQPVVTDIGEYTGAVSPAGTPTIVWSDFDEIHLLQWTGGAWTGLGGSDGPGGLSQTPGASITPELAFDPQGRPGVAWRDSSYPDDWSETYFKRWNGAAWEELGGSATGRGVSQMNGATIYIGLAFDPAGDPGIGWEEWGGFGGLTLMNFKRWNGTSWVGHTLSDTGALGYGIGPSLEYDSSGCPAIAYNSTLGACFRRVPGLPASKLRQFAADGTTPIPLGGTAGATVVFACDALPMAGDFQLEVDVAGPGLAFDGIPEIASGSVPADAPAAAAWYAGTPGDYRWRARIVTALGVPQTVWVEFGPVPAASPDFVVSAPAPPGPPGSNGAGGGSKGEFKTGCSAGASAGSVAPGMAALLLLIAAQARRSRARR